MYKYYNFFTSLPTFAIACHFFFFLILANLVGMKWSLIVVWNCISLLADEVEHLFTCSPTIHISSMEKYLFKLCFYL